ncbi:MAG: MFS transporter [Nitrososphaerales archaeon]|jgi:EmrB/QacA subfamily drug resistance transporter
MPSEGRYRATVLAIVMTGVMMSAIDTTAVVLGLPVMMRDLHSDIVSMIWVIMSYLLVITILGTQVGRLGDMYGRARLYNLGFAVFTVGSLLSGISATGAELIACRVVQGLGGALISSNSGAVIADTFPANERGKAYGFTGVGWSVGAILGILIGGAFVTFLDWRYIFFINLPIGIVATSAGFYLLKERSPRVKARLDVVGMAALGTGLFLVLLGLTNLTGSGGSVAYDGEIAGGLVLALVFALYERRSSSPLIDVRLLQQRILTASILAAFFQALASFAVLFLIIMFLQGPRGLSPFDGSLLLVPGYVLGAAVAPFSGRLADRLGARVVASAGLILQILGIVVYSTLSLSSSLDVVVLGSVVSGLGSSSFFPANNSAVMASAPRNAYGVASGLLRTLSNVGMVCSFAMALLIASLSIPRQLAFEIFLGAGGISGPLSTAFIQGMRSALTASVALLLVALALSVLRGKETRSSAPASPRPTESAAKGG